MEKLRYIVFFILLFLPASSYGAIVFDTSSTSGSASTTTNTWSHTIGSGNNRLLVVTVRQNDSSSAVANVTSVSYNGVALTKAVDLQVGAGPYLNSEIWYLLESGLPAAGTYTVVVTFSGSTNQSRCGAMSFFNASQAAPEATASEDCSGTDTCTTPITTIADNAWIVSFVGTTSQVTEFGVGPLQIIRYTQDSFAGAATRATTTPGAFNPQWTFGATVTRVSHVLASFAPQSNNLSPGAIATTEAFGTHTLSEIVVLEISSISTAESFGTLAMTREIEMNLQGIASGERVPLPFIWSQLTPDPTPISPTLIEE